MSRNGAVSRAAKEEQQAGGSVGVLWLGGDGRRKERGL